MSKVLVNESSLTAIAKAIRYNSSDSSTKYKPSEMAEGVTRACMATGQAAYNNGLDDGRVQGREAEANERDKQDAEYLSDINDKVDDYGVEKAETLSDVPDAVVAVYEAGINESKEAQEELLALIEYYHKTYEGGGVSAEEFLAENPGFFDNVDTSTYYIGNTMSALYKESFQSSIQGVCTASAATSADFWLSFDHMGYVIHKDIEGIYSADNLPAIGDVLQSPDTTIHLEDEMLFGTYQKYVTLDVLTRPVWLNEPDVIYYAFPFMTKDGVVYTRAKAYKASSLRELSQALSNQSSGTTKEFYSAVVNLIEKYAAYYPASTYSLRRPIARDDSALGIIS